MSPEPPTPAQITEDSDELDLRELLGTLWDHRWLIGIVTGTFLVISVAYALLATPVYQANAMVQVEQKVPTLPGLSDLSQLVGDSAPQAVTEISLMTSRMVVGKAVDNLRLHIVVTPSRFPLIGGFIARRYKPDKPGAVAGPWLGMNRYDWGGARLSIYQLDVPSALMDQSLSLVAGGNGRFELYDEDDNLLLEGPIGQPVRGHGVTIQVQTLHANPGMRFEVVRQWRLAAIRNLLDLLDASEQDKDSGILAVLYQDEDPARATAVLDELVRLYVRQNVERSSAEAANSLEFVNKQLPDIRLDLEKAETALSAYQTKVHTADLSLQTKGLLDQIVAVETNLSQLKLQQAEVQRRYTPEHPAYRALLQQQGELAAKKQGLEAEVSGLPDTQQELLHLTRDVQVSTEIYTTMLGQAQQLDIARAGTVGNARVVDEAAVDITQPVKPKKALIVLVGILLGGFLALVWVFLRRMLSRGVENPQVIEQLGLPVYASVPLSTFQRDVEDKPLTRHGHRASGNGRLHLLALDNPADLAVEAVRSLRTSLHFAMLEAKNNILMISGASPNAGKTFISTNLAAVVAQAGQRVLLLDGDLRKGTLHRVMGSGAEPGLSELLVGKTDLAAVVHKTAIETLHFIGRGHVPPNPSELLMHANFTRLLLQLAEAYDLLIVDTPPILAVTDAAIIGSQAGTSLLVARFGMNQARELALAKQRFEQNRVELKGAIFNAVQKRATGYYSYGYYKYDSQKA